MSCGEASTMTVRKDHDRQSQSEYLEMLPPGVLVLFKIPAHSDLYSDAWWIEPYTFLYALVYSTVVELQS